MKKETKEEDILTTARDRFKAAADAESENRDKAQEDLRFESGDQWPETLRTARENAGQPALVINRTATYVRNVVNDIRKIRPSIKIRGVDSQSDPYTAEALNGLIRAIEADSTATSAYDWGEQHAVSMGWGYWLIDTEYETPYSFDQVIKICRVRNQFSAYLDPTADEADGSDAKWGFLVEWQDKDELERKYGIELGEWPEYDSYTRATWDEWYTKDQARVARYWCRETKPFTLTLMSDGSLVDGTPEPLGIPGEPYPVDTRESEHVTIVHRLITGHKVLDTTEWPGKYIPLVRCIGEERVIDADVEYKGMVRDLQDPARQYNYMRSASVERIALTPKAPWVGPRGSFDDTKWDRANRENFAFLEYDIVSEGHRPTREAPPDASPGLVSEVQHTVEELKAVSGIFDPSLGDRSNEIAGVAIDARKKQTEVSNYHYIDNYAKAITYTGRILVDLIPKIYTGNRVVNILGIDGEEDRIPLNQAFVDQKGQQRMVNLDVGRYDAVVDTGTDYSTQREEATESMMEFVKAFPQAAPLLGDLLAKNFDWPQADEISKRLKLMLPPEILKGESPQIANLMQQFDVERKQVGEFVQQLQEQIRILGNELQAEREKRQIDLLKIQEDARQADLQHVEGMTKLELEAGRDLAASGKAFDG